MGECVCFLNASSLDECVSIWELPIGGLFICMLVRVKWAELELWWRHPHCCAGLAGTSGDCFAPCRNEMHQLEMSVLAERPVLRASRAYSPGSVRRAETEVCVSGCLWGC